MSVSMDWSSGQGSCPIRGQVHVTGPQITATLIILSLNRYYIMCVIPWHHGDEDNDGDDIDGGEDD